MFARVRVYVVEYNRRWNRGGTSVTTYLLRGGGGVTLQDSSRRCKQQSRVINFSYSYMLRTGTFISRKKHYFKVTSFLGK
jgi:hypothetical protein